MADQGAVVGNGLTKRWRDINLDGSFAEVVSLPIRDGASWDGSAIDLRDYGSVAIWCTTAPSAGYAIEASGDGTNFVGQTAVSNSAAGIGTTASLVAAGRFVLPGGCFVRLTGGTGGAFQVSAQA